MNSLHVTGRLRKKNLLLYDVHKLHKYNLYFLRLMVTNNIKVLAIPGHTSHILQPLYSTSFANFKTAWNQSLSQYLVSNAGCAMPKHHFWIPFWPSWHKAMTVAVIQSGFRKTEIFPVNRRMIKDSDLGPSATTDNTLNLQAKMYSKMVVN